GRGGAGARQLAQRGRADRYQEARMTGAHYPGVDLQPRLVGDLIELRPLREDDWEVLFAVASDPLIWEQHPAYDRYREDVFQGFFREAMASGGALVAIDRKTQQVIGSSRYLVKLDPDSGNPEIEIGWTFLARSHWGGKYNGEMKRLMVE